MKKFLLIGLVILTHRFVISQSINGVWIGEYRETIQRQKIETSLTNGSSETLKLNEIKIDTIYYSANFLMSFKPDNEVLVSGLGGSHSIDIYEHIGNDTIKFDYQKESLTIERIDDNYMRILDLDSSWSDHTFLLRKLKPNKVHVTSEYVATLLKHTKWKIHSDSSSKNNQLELHFIDSSSIVLTKIINGYGYTTSGKYDIIDFDGIPLLLVFDDRTWDECLYLLTEIKDSEIKAETYELRWDDIPTVKTEVHFKYEALPSSEEYDKIRENLVGRWFTDSTPIPFYSYSSDYDTLMDSYFQINFFENNEFKINYGGDYVKDQNIEKKTKNNNGAWRLGESGKYIELVYDTTNYKYMETDYHNYRPNFMTIIELNNNRAYMTYDILSIGFGNV